MGYKPPKPQTPEAPPIPAVAKNPHTEAQSQEWENRKRVNGIAATWLRDMGLSQTGYGNKTLGGV